MSDARDEAAHNAMWWAREAQRHEEGRQAETTAWNRLGADPEAGPNRGTRMRAHEDNAHTLTEARNNAITMATMWAAVADVQDPV